MKKFALSSLAGCFMIFIVSCTSTQFSSTERINKKGHVFYKNKYQKEVRFDHARKVTSHRQKEETPGIKDYTRDNSTISQLQMDHEMVLASTSDKLIIVNNNPITINSLLEPDTKNSHDQSNKIITNNATGHQVFIRPDTIIKKQDTSNYSRGTVYQANQPPKKIEGLGLAGMITGVIGLFIAGIPLGILSLIFGIAGVMRVNKNPKRLMGKGFGIAAIILGIVDIVGALIALSLVK